MADKTPGSYIKPFVNEESFVVDLLEKSEGPDVPRLTEILNEWVETIKLQQEVIMSLQFQLGEAKAKLEGKTPGIPEDMYHLYH